MADFFVSSKLIHYFNDVMETFAPYNMNGNLTFMWMELECSKENFQIMIITYGKSSYHLKWNMHDGNDQRNTQWAS